MARPYLTLNIPNRGLASGTPVVASHNPRLLLLFRRFVLADWEARVHETGDDTLAEIDRLELQKLRATLDILVPDIDETNDTGGNGG